MRTISCLFVFCIIGLILANCGLGQSDVTPTKELLEKIQKAVTSPNPEIIKEQRQIPVVIFANGARMKIGEAKFGTTTIISDPSDPLKFRGTDKSTAYEGGGGAVILNGEKVYLYKLSLPQGLYGDQK